MENLVGQQPQSVQVPNYSGVNIQIFNPSVSAPGAGAPISTVNAGNYSTVPSYPPNYYTQNLAQPPVPEKTAPEPEKKKTEKREIVTLTDSYIKTLEEHLSSQNKQIRLMGAKEVLARLQEDDSRKNDTALNALINKMLQDPYQSVKFIAMAALESRVVTGNSLTAKLLTNMQQQKTSSKTEDAHKNEDALKASKILLKMSGTTIQKEFEVKDKAK